MESLLTLPGLAVYELSARIPIDAAIRFTDEETQVVAIVRYLWISTGRIPDDDVLQKLVGYELYMQAALKCDEIASLCSRRIEAIGITMEDYEIPLDDR